MITIAQEVFAQYVGCYGHTPTTATIALFPDKTTKHCERLGRKWMRDPEVAALVEKYRDSVQQQAIIKASEVISFDKQTAMRHLGNVIERAKQALTHNPMDETVKKVMDLIYCCEKDYFSKKEIDWLTKKLTTNFDHKSAETLLKATDQANKLYGNYELKLTIDDRRDKLATKLDSLSEDKLIEMSGFEDEENELATCDNRNIDDTRDDK